VCVNRRVTCVCVCNALQHDRNMWYLLTEDLERDHEGIEYETKKRCNTLQHTMNTLQRTATHYNMRA